MRQTASRSALSIVLLVELRVGRGGREEQLEGVVSSQTLEEQDCIVLN